MDSGRGIALVAMPEWRVSIEMMGRIREASGMEVVRCVSGEDAEPYLDRTEIAFGDISFALLPRMPRLKWVQLWSAGADQLQRYPETKALPFALSGTSGMHGRQIAEHFFGMYFAFIRGLPAAFAAQSRGEWLKMDGAGLSSAWGKRLLILGFGAIGLAIARSAVSFGMKVTGIRRSARAGSAEPLSGGESEVRLEPVSKLRELLPGADVVLNILPYTQETFHLFGEAEFALMKQGALYANVGRGAVTDEAAMIRALRERRIAGALLDVFETEPLPASSPLWSLPNALLSPHYAGLSAGYNTAAFEIALDNLGRYMRGAPLQNLIDKERGY